MSDKIIDSEGINCSRCGKDVYHCVCCPLGKRIYSEDYCDLSCHWYVSETECKLRTAIQPGAKEGTTGAYGRWYSDEGILRCRRCGCPPVACKCQEESPK